MTNETTAGLARTEMHDRLRWLVEGVVEEPPDKRPNKRGEETRARLVDAASECFAEYGYTHTRISDICHRAGIAQGTFYRHFSNLDEAFIAALLPALDDLARSTEGSRPAGAQSASLDALVDTNTHYVEMYARHRDLLRVMREAAAASPNDGFVKMWLRLRAAFVDRTRAWLEHLHDEGEIRKVDFELLAEALGSLTEQMVYVHVGLPTATPRPERLAELGRTIGEVWYRTLPR